ncbi:MAG: hypothetical protein M3138_03100 [Actinomycetota bacterium]|nr:hypothetical protein [Actinomycetota bacterium]
MNRNPEVDRWFDEQGHPLVLVAGSGLRFDDAGEHELKGVPDRWPVYTVVG